MKVSVSVHGRWHAFELATELQDRGLLSQLLTTYPRMAVKKITTRTLPVISRPSLEIRRRMYDRWRFGAKPDRKIAAAFGRFASKQVSPDTNLFIGWSSASLEVIPIVQGRGGKVVIERGSTHIQHQMDMLRTGYERVGLPWDGTDPLIVERELAEYQAADAIAVPTTFARQSFIDHGIPGDKIIVNPYGTDLSERAGGREKIGGGPLRLLFVGGISVRKGAPWLIEALKDLEGQAACRFAGPVEPALRQMYGEGFPDNVELLGPLSSADVDRELSAADVFCLPSLEEGFPLSLLEAMAAGLTCVVTPAASGGVVRDGKNGVLVPPMDVRALVTALDSISADRSRLAALGEAARAAVQDGYSWRDYGDRAVAAYEVLFS